MNTKLMHPHRFIHDGEEHVLFTGENGVVFAQNGETIFALPHVRVAPEHASAVLRVLDAIWADGYDACALDVKYYGGAVAQDRLDNKS